MSLKNFIEANAPGDLVAEVCYEAGISLELAYWPETELIRRIKASEVRGGRKKGKVRDQRFRLELVSAVRGWKGVTPRALAELGIIRLASVKPEQRDQAEPFSAENLLDLMEFRPGLDVWLVDQITNPENFPLLEEQENLAGGPAGGPGPEGKIARDA